tara:strand:- start:125346 stop:126866 length:1521 start_codon:yes stop_codon:yes gene_type:complete
MGESLKSFLVQAKKSADSAPDYMTAAARPIKVLLIQGPTTDGVQSFLPQVEEGEAGIGYKPPLGILYIATNIAENSPHEVKVIDSIAEELSFEEIVAKTVEFAPDVVGISAWTDFWYPAYRTGELIKQALPDTHLCFGGPHLGIYPKETLDVPFVDSVVCGDGETPFLYLCNMVSHGVVDNSMDGLHFKEHGVKPVLNVFYVEGDLDALPIPDRTFMPIENYSSVLGKQKYVTTMITSRGCPHRCTFCKLNFQKNLARSADSIVEEFHKIHALGIREVEIYDDTFTWSRKRLREICEGLIEADLGVEWAIRDRVSSASVDDDLLDLMHRAGCRRIHFGIESGVQHVVDRMKKKITLDQARDAVRLAKQAKMTVLTYFMFGNLDETKADMYQTIEFAKELDADYAQFSITIPYAGTEMYTEGLSSGIIKSDFWGAYATNPTPNFLPPEIIETYATLDELKKIRNDAVQKFYFRPRYIAREMLKLGSFHEFVRKAKMGLQLAESVYTK